MKDCTCSSEPLFICQNHTGDRRRADRRKVQWWQNIAVCTENGYLIGYQTVKYPTADRRSGKDRRKQA